MKTFTFLGAILAFVLLTNALVPAGQKAQPKSRISDAGKTPPKVTMPKGTPTEQVRALIAQHENAMAAFPKLFEAAKTDEEQEKLEALLGSLGELAQDCANHVELRPGPGRSLPVPWILRDLVDLWLSTTGKLERGKVWVENPIKHVGVRDHVLRGR
jgi:hypothetical protein